jgi:hypothetical protein
MLGKNVILQDLIPGVEEIFRYPKNPLQFG